MANQVFCGCGGLFKTTRIGVYVLEWAGGRPYKLWAADELSCQKCGAIVMRSNPKPLKHPHDDGFEDAIWNQAKAGKLAHVDLSDGILWQRWIDKYHEGG